MIDVPVYSMEGGSAGTRKVNEEVFGDCVRFRLLKEVIVASEAAHRSGTASTRERSEVVGTTAKPWRQKGTGRARAGSVKSPIWRGGGTVFGPRPRNYAQSISKRSRQTALRSVLLLKLKEGSVKVVKNLAVKEPKTKELYGFLARIDAASSTVIVVSEFNENLWLSGRNIHSVDVVTADQLDARMLASRKNLVIAEDAMKVLEGKV